MMDLNLFIDVVEIGLIAGGIGIVIMSVLPLKKRVETGGSTPLRSEGPVFLFDGDVVVDCNAAAQALLARSPEGSTDYGRLMGVLSKYFSNLSEKLTNLPNVGALAETAETGNGKLILLQAELVSGLTKISLSDPDITEGPGVALALSHRVLETEVDDLRHMLSAAPIPMWRESPTGDVVWANTAYLILLGGILDKGHELTWPLPRLFDRSAVLQSAQNQWQSVINHDKGLQWFDLITKQEKAGLLCFAIPADATVAAESSLRDFMQTLSKTFAQLPIGLAVFDKDRRLQIFNPALVELTRLQPDFLIQRPSMLSVLDAMRDQNMLPEPKDYQSWRRHVTEMERAAASGLFQENWTLPDGQTFRVTGRPHPNGGLALMIEDISSEMQRSRRYRADLDINQSVIDQLEDAIAVFSQSGQLMWCNAAYTQLWGHDPAATMGDMTIRLVTDQWKTRAPATPLWAEIDEYIHTIGSRKAWAKELRLADGRLITCAATPISAGSTMIAFKPSVPQNTALPHKLSTKLPTKSAVSGAEVQKTTDKASAAR